MKEIEKQENPIPAKIEYSFDAEATQTSINLGATTIATEIFQVLNQLSPEKIGLIENIQLKLSFQPIIEATINLKK